MLTISAECQFKLKSALRTRKSPTLKKEISFATMNTMSSTSSKSIGLGKRTESVYLEESYQSRIEPLKDTRKVSFSKIVRVCLIPCRHEFEYIKHHLWWSAQEIDIFKNDSYRELKYTIESQGVSLKQALAILYQCSNSTESTQYVGDDGDLSINTWKISGVDSSES